MKKLILFLLSSVSCFALLPPPPASVSDVSTGTDQYKYVTPYALANSGISGGGAAVSNQVIAAVVANFYTNRTPHYLVGYARLGISVVGTMQCAVTNSANTLFFHYTEDALSVGATSNTIAFSVPPYGWYKFAGQTTVLTDGSQALFYYATNGSVTYATSAGNAATVTDGATQSGLAAGSYAIKEQALTGFLRFSSTNTAFIDGAATNAITVVSNTTDISYASFVISGSSIVSGTYYYKSPGVLTNSATMAAVFWSGGVDTTYSQDIQITNAAHPTLDSDIAGIVSGASQPLYIQSGATEVLQGDASSSFSPAVFVTTLVTNRTTSPAYASFNGKHVGNGSALVNLPAPGAGVVVETNVSFPVSGLATVNANFFWQTTNASPGKIGFLTLEHGGGHGIAVVGGVSGDVVLNPGTDDGILQIGVTGNMGNRIYLQYGMYPWASTNTVGVSHPLEFRSRVYDGGSLTTKYPGIVGFSEANNSSELGKLVFYARAPSWNAGNLNAAAPNTAGTEVFSAGTNGVVAASGIRFKGDTFTVSTVTITSGSGSPESVVTAPIGSLFLRTDGSTSTTLYVKTSGAGNTGWTAK